MLDLPPDEPLTGPSVGCGGIWPTPWPDRWHVGLTTTLLWVTRDPVPSERVVDVLQAWGFELDQHTSFCYWRWGWPATAD